MQEPSIIETASTPRTNEISLFDFRGHLNRLSAHFRKSADVKATAYNKKVTKSEVMLTEPN